jgi:hypothetical protein
MARTTSHRDVIGNVGGRSGVFPFDMTWRHPHRMAGAIITALLFMPTATHAGPAETDIARLLTLATLADAVYDTQPAWHEEARRLPELPRLVEHVASYIEEDGYGDGHIPSVVSMDADFGGSRSLVSGRYDRDADRVDMNARFLTDPSWADRPWLGVLIHEMLHAEGYPIEAQVQVITTEILASMANDGYPGALVELSDRLRRHALLSAWWLAAYEHEALPTELASTDRSPFCEMGCTQVSGDVSQVDSARRKVFDAAELRQTLARERSWQHSQHDHDSVLGSYVAEPLGVILSATCGDRASIRLVRRHGWPPLFPSVDDTRAFLEETGWCTPP